MDMSSRTKIVIGIVGPIDIKLVKKQKEWSDSPVGNEYPMFSYFVNYLIDNNYKVNVYTTSPGIKKKVQYIDDHVSIFVAPKRSRKYAKHYFLEVRELRAMLKASPSDVLFAQWTYEFALSAINSGLRTIVTINDNARKIFLIRPTINKFIKLLINRLVLQKSTQLIAVSEYIYNNLSAGVRNKTIIIPNFYPDYLERLFIEYKNRKKIIVTFCNGFGKRTNVQKAVEGFKIFNERNINSQFEYHLIGEGTEVKGKLYSYAHKINAPLEKMHFHGYLSHPDAMEVLKFASLLIHPSLEEANSITIIESMVLGVPVIGNIFSDAVKEQLSGDAGYLCNTKCAFEINRYIAYCINNSGHCQEVLLRARYHALKKYNIQNVIEQQISLI